MAVIVAKEIVKDTKEMRGALSEALIARAKDNKNLVYLDADLSSSMSMKNFAKAYPDRYLNVPPDSAVLSTDEISPVFLYMLTVSLPSRTFTAVSYTHLSDKSLKYGKQTYWLIKQK